MQQPEPSQEIDNRTQETNNMQILSITSNKATVRYNNQYYVVSHSLHRDETLIFPSNSNGEIKQYVEVGGGSSVSLSSVLEDFSSFLH